jgi:hypothetical protein
MPVLVKSYTSPTLVLLAYDWPAADLRSDFRGFGIERTPGFAGAERSWLPRPTGAEAGAATPEAPIRKFYWWDTSIDASDRGAHFQYRVVPVIGPEDSLQLLEQEAGQIDVLVP